MIRALTVLLFGLGTLGLLFWFMPHVAQMEYESPIIRITAPLAAIDVELRQSQTAQAVRSGGRVMHVPLPDPLHAIYMSACVAGTPDLREGLIELVETTDLNAIMIDIKDSSGGVAFPNTHPVWGPAWEHSPCGAPDMRALIADLHARGIYVIGRITTFQDPMATARFPEWAVTKLDRETIWKDFRGLSFIDVAATEYWDHIIDLAVLAYNIGYDEINFDYVRYPTDGNMRDIAFPVSEVGVWGLDKAANLEAFFAYLHAAMTDEARFAGMQHVNTGRAVAVPWTSVDIFGMTTVNYDDLSIGQVLERTTPYFDFVAPMVYPSHYPQNYLGLGNPNNNVYEIVAHAMQSGVDRIASPVTRVPSFMYEQIPGSSPPRYQQPTYGPDKLRTWIQDFDYGGEYDATKVRAQIQASRDVGVMSYMVWSPSSRYTDEAYADNYVPTDF